MDSFSKPFRTKNVLLIAGLYGGLAAVLEVPRPLTSRVPRAGPVLAYRLAIAEPVELEQQTIFLQGEGRAKTSCTNSIDGRIP